MKSNKYHLGDLITQRREKNPGGNLPIRGVSKNGLQPPKQIDADTSIYNLYYKNDFVYNPARMELGSIAFNDEYDKAICSSLYEVFYVHRTDLILPEYLALFVKQPEFARCCEFLGSGSAREYCRFDTISGIPIILPPISEQKIIVHDYKVLTTRMELLRIMNQNISSQLETLLLYYMEDKNATLVKLGDYLYIKGRIGWKGLKKSEYLQQSKFRIINGDTLTKTGIDWSRAGYIPQERYEESAEIMLRVGDILLSKDGTIGKIGYVDNLELPTSVASGIFVIRNTKPDIISTIFIYFLLKSNLFESFIAARTEGSVIPHLYQRDFMEFVFPLPSTDKMAEFEKIAEPLFSLMVLNNRESQCLASLKDTILSKLLSGEQDKTIIDS